MNGEAERILKAFAGRVGLRVRRRVEVFLTPDDPAVAVVTVRHGKRVVRALASSSSLVLTAEVRVPVFFSVGAPNRALLVTEQLTTPGAGRLSGKVFVSAGFEAAVEQWLSSSVRSRAIERVGLSPGESLHVARNEVTLVLRPQRGVDSALEVLGALIAAVGEPEARPEQAAQLLPADFADLEPLAAGWTIGDDADRELALSQLTEGERARLLATLGPRLNDIDAYLLSFDRSNALSDEAIRLQALGELGAELNISLNSGQATTGVDQNSATETH